MGVVTLVQIDLYKRYFTLWKCKFSSASRFLFKRFSRNITLPMPEPWCEFGRHRFIYRALYIGDKVHFLQYLVSCPRDVSEISLITLRMPGLYMAQFWCGIKVMLHGRQSEFSSVFRFVFKNLSRNITDQNLHKRSVSDIHGCNQSITKGTLLGEQSLNLHLRMTHFPKTLRLTLFTHVPQTKRVWLRYSNNERHFTWGNKLDSRLYSGFESRDFSRNSYLALPTHGPETE